MDARLHPNRLERARRRVSELRPRSVLFVCLGNVCRSPYAERAFNSRVGPHVRATSGGFIGPDRPPPEPALEAAAARGIEHRDHRSRLLTSDILEGADAIFIFDRHNMKSVRSKVTTDPHRVLWLGDLDPIWAGKRAIIDPWGKPASAFEQTFERIDRCLSTIVPAVSDAAEDSETTDPSP